MQKRYKIDRDFLRSLTAEGKFREFPDADLRGFVVRMTPAGAVTYTIRWQKPDGMQGRKTIGKWPQMNPGEARELARKEMGNVDKKNDSTAEILDRNKRKQAAAKIVAAQITLRTFLDGDYGDWQRTHRKTGQATVDRIKQAFPDLLDKPLDEFNSWIIQKWRADRLKAGLKEATVNRDINALRAVFSRAMEWDKLTEHPLAKVKRLKETGGSVVRYLSATEEAALRVALDKREDRERHGRESANRWRAERGYDLMPAITAHDFADHIKPMVLVSINTGLRKGELFALLWSDVDLERAHLTVRDEEAKSGKTRHIPLSAEARQALATWMRQTNPKDADGLVFKSATGGKFNNITKAWTALLDAAGIQNFRWHDLRHHFASRLVMAGVDLNTVRELLGHSDFKLTLRYAHLAPEHKAAAISVLDRPRIAEEKSASATSR